MLQYIHSNSYNPRFNLALEQYVFDEMDRNKNYFLLWQNANTLVVGKHQNTFAEINQSFVNEKKINVVRRLSGGGAVYHDMGNLNFTFITDQDEASNFNFKYFCQPIVETLQAVGVPAEIQGRNDIVIDNKKFSGNSQYAKQGRVMHHGTIMFDVDLSILSNALSVSKDKIESKGITSVRSRVANIVDYLPDKSISLNDFSNLLLNTISKVDQIEKYELTNKDIEHITEIKEQRYDKWDWNFGYSPKHYIQKSRRIEGVGKFDIYMDVEQGKIADISFYGDFFGNGGKNISRKLKGVSLTSSAISNVISQGDIDVAFRKLSLERLVELIIE